MRFSVPASDVVQGAGAGAGSGDISTADRGGDLQRERSAIGQLIILLEQQKEALGIEHYSVTPTTLDQVFLTIVGQHNVKEENYDEKVKKTWWKRK
ncbi:hypothetical protein G7054_g12998 [Neopestalotiopsis clavispora]|nr:hypothetical protein G7054_g12998 [Neopestalotiopsis clavispora]